ncbi:hypothetical protein [Yoonia sp. BS5-3]|uniref:UrcA family protein n=1 Tax=Yoonia phaeophyticola TaxID=3137369 RepID=A0ABZ2VBC1_9RHOB
MKIRVKLPLALACVLTTTTLQAAAQECTQEEIFERTTAISEIMLGLAASDPDKMTEMSTALTVAMDEATASGDVTAICVSLDEILADATPES